MLPTYCVIGDFQEDEHDHTRPLFPQTALARMRINPAICYPILYQLHPVTWECISLNSSKTSVLVVDDDTSIRETLRYVLEDAGYAVIEARDGIQALEYLRKSPQPMVVLLDLMMPRMDGAGVLGTVAGDPWRLHRHSYILMTAGHQTLSLAFAHMLADLSVPVIYKPFDIDGLLELVASQKS